MCGGKLEQVLRLVDAANREDPNREVWQGAEYPREYLYGLRMSEWLERLCPEASDVLRIAARGQHIRRWEVPRSGYPATREGYLQWRRYLYGFHGDRVAELMHQVGYERGAAERVKTILAKRGLRNDAEVQWIEDAACLVFLEYYFAEFMNAHGVEKLINIVRRTWNKMSEQARMQAMKMEFPGPVKTLLARALEGT